MEADLFEHLFDVTARYAAGATDVMVEPLQRTLQRLFAGRLNRNGGGGEATARNGNGNVLDLSIMCGFLSCLRNSGVYMRFNRSVHKTRLYCIIRTVLWIPSIEFL